MKLKKNYLIFYIIINLIFIIFINIKNTNKVNINIFTWKSNDKSLGNILTSSYFAGISFNALLTLLITSNERAEKIKDEEEEFLPEKEYQDINDFSFEETNIERPPERDLKESQPTISVNYRVINRNRYNSEKINNESDFRSSKNVIYDDWGETDNDW